jgi:hypothetical protein
LFRRKGKLSTVSSSMWGRQFNVGSDRDRVS